MTSVMPGVGMRIVMAISGIRVVRILSLVTSIIIVIPSGVASSSIYRSWTVISIALNFLGTLLVGS